MSFVILTFLSASLGGCGSQTYELRLEETKKYFSYLNKVNASLHAAESGLVRDYKITIRIPIQFNFIPPPVPTESEENEEPVPVPPEADERQRKFMNTILPGLLGAWEADLVVQYAEEDEEAEADEEEEDAGADTAKGYIYLLGNHLKWIAKEEDASVEPLSFAVEATDAIASGFRMPPDRDEQPWDWAVKKKPSGEAGYVGKKVFDAFEFGANEGDPEIEIDGAYYNVELYIHEVGDIQVLLMIVAPIDTATSEKLGERVGLMLEQLEVEAVTPKSPATRALDDTGSKF